MFNTEIKAIVNQGWGDYKEVWLIKRVADKTYNGTIKNGLIEWKEIKEGALVETPFLKLDGRNWNEIVTALTEKAPPIKKEIIEAELKATHYHLEDMRKLVFKNK